MVETLGTAVNPCGDSADIAPPPPEDAAVAMLSYLPARVVWILIVKPDDGSVVDACRGGRWLAPLLAVVTFCPETRA